MVSVRRQILIVGAEDSVSVYLCEKRLREEFETSVDPLWDFGVLLSLGVKVRYSDRVRCFVRKYIVSNI